MNFGVLHYCNIGVRKLCYFTPAGRVTPPWAFTWENPYKTLPLQGGLSAPAETVTRFDWVPHLSCKRDHDKKRDYMDHLRNTLQWSWTIALSSGQRGENTANIWKTWTWSYCLWSLGLILRKCFYERLSRRATPLPWITSSTWGPSPPCKQDVKHSEFNFQWEGDMIWFSTFFVWNWNVDTCRIM